MTVITHEMAGWEPHRNMGTSRRGDFRASADAGQLVFEYRDVPAQVGSGAAGDAVLNGRNHDKQITGGAFMESAADAELEYIEAVMQRSGPPYQCRRCGRELQEGEIMVSLMGNGISCADWQRCVVQADDPAGQD